jgi:hypothetical protein
MTLPASCAATKEPSDAHVVDFPLTVRPTAAEAHNRLSLSRGFPQSCRYGSTGQVDRDCGQLKLLDPARLRQRVVEGVSG